MTAPWMPPLPEPNAWRVDASFFANYDSIPFALLPPVGDPKPLYTTDQMRQAQADAARAALEQAIKLCKEEEDRLWRAYKGHGEPHEEYSPVIEGASDQCAVLADAIRALAKEIT